MYALICINQVHFVDILELKVFTEGIFDQQPEIVSPFYHVFSNKLNKKKRKCKTSRMIYGKNLRNTARNKSVKFGVCKCC